MTQKAILTIEDDAAIRRGIVDSLRWFGYRVFESARGDEGLEMAVRLDYDLLLLDLVLPHVSGLEILREVRRSRPTHPVIVLTARGEEDDRVAGLRLGADDYVIKPFSVKELAARIEAVLRRTPARPSDVSIIPLETASIDLERREVRSNDGSRNELSERECDLLRYLASHRGRAISREELLANVWRIAPDGVTTRTIDMHIARLREKLGESTGTPRCLLTVRGKGYMLAACDSENS